MHRVPFRFKMGLAQRRSDAEKQRTGKCRRLRLLRNQEHSRTPYRFFTASLPRGSASLRESCSLREGREAPCGSYRKTRISGRLVRNRDYVACLDRTSPQIIVRDPRKARGRVTIRPELSSSDRVKIDNCSKLGGCLVVPFSPQPSVFGFAGGKHCGLGNLFGRKYRCVSSRVKKAPRGYPVPFSSDENWDSPQVL